MAGILVRHTRRSCPDGRLMRDLPRRINDERRLLCERIYSAKRHRRHMKGRGSYNPGDNRGGKIPGSTLV